MEMRYEPKVSDEDFICVTDTLLMVLFLTPQLRHVLVMEALVCPASKTIGHKRIWKCIKTIF